MTEKTIKTDEIVHNELERLKREYGVETFNDVLRRQLGIDPGTDVNKLAAFLDDELRQAVDVVIDEIEAVAQLQRGYEKEYGAHQLTFLIPESNRKVADIRFKDGSFRVRYRTSKGDMKVCGKGYENSDAGVRFGTIGDLYDRYDVEDVRASVREKVEKSYRRWCQE